LTVVLDNIRSCHNIGSIFRTSDALLVEKLWLCGITATPPNKEIHKTALDAEKSVLWEYQEETLEVVGILHRAGYRVYAIEQAENSLYLPDFRVDVQGKTALIFGNELKGVQQQVIDQVVPDYPSTVIFGIRQMPWAGKATWKGTRTMLVDWVDIEPLP
jgi:tRNA G18 (ribose-2'-O)-methylase SpoU